MPEEAISAAEQLGDKVDELRGDIKDLGVSIEKQRQSIDDNKAWTRRRFVAFMVAIVLMAATMALGGVALGYAVREAHCNRAYNNANAQRNSVVSPASLNLNISMGKLMEAAFRPPAGQSKAETTTQFNAALATYFDHFDTYITDYGANPLPVAPKYAC